MQEHEELLKECWHISGPARCTVSFLQSCGISTRVWDALAEPSSCKIPAGRKGRSLAGFCERITRKIRRSASRPPCSSAAWRTAVFSGITLEELLTAYFGEELTIRKEERRKEEERREGFFAGILAERGKGAGGGADEGAEEGAGEAWLRRTLAERGGGYELLMQQYREGPEELGKLLNHVLDGIDSLPCQPRTGERDRQLLAVFAAGVTGNPHYFDVGTAAEKLLSAYLNTRSSVRACLERNGKTSFFIRQAC